MFGPEVSLGYGCKSPRGFKYVGKASVCHGVEVEEEVR